ncbi:MAG TPA: hypothetical protein VF868_03125 [Bacteroidia bacterium]|jgi:hypothetical protein
MIPIDYNKLIHSATYYLSYQDRIGRNFMIDESSLKYPIADYLSGLEIPLTQIQLEYSHPDLKKRQIDLITTDASKKQIESAFEFKISRQNTKYETEQKRIFNDLMRLHLIANSKKTSCYFIMAGKHSDFIQFFRSIATKRPSGTSKDLPAPEGFYTEWFKFKAKEVCTFDVKNSPGVAYKNIYSSFLIDYKPKDDSGILTLPDKITTTCMEISPLSREFPTPYVGGIWKIE